MKKPILFLLNHWLENGVRYYCPQCATVEGILAYFPELRENLDIRYVEYQRPRKEIVEILGEENQSCPVLILNPRDFLTDEIAIGKRLSELFSLPQPH